MCIRFFYKKNKQKKGEKDYVLITSSDFVVHFESQVAFACLGFQIIINSVFCSVGMQLLGVTFLLLLRTFHHIFFSITFAKKSKFFDGLSHWISILKSPWRPYYSKAHTHIYSDSIIFLFDLNGNRPLWMAKVRSSTSSSSLVSLNSHWNTITIESILLKFSSSFAFCNINYVLSLWAENFLRIWICWAQRCWHDMLWRCFFLI